MKRLTSFIHLIDFIGHPSLTEQYLNNRRYSTLMNLISERKSSDDKVITTLFDPGNEPIGETSAFYLEKYLEIKNKAISENFTWLEFFPTSTVNDIINSLKDHGYQIHPSYTQIVFGGTNLAGCVLHNKNTCIHEFAKYGYFCQLLLPLCSPDDAPGHNDIEKLFCSFAQVYNFIKRKEITHLVDVLFSEFERKLKIDFENDL